jgi:hypothetical protein
MEEDLAESLRTLECEERDMSHFVTGDMLDSTGGANALDRS